LTCRGSSEPAGTAEPSTTAAQAAKTMFTQSCSNVKAPGIALARISFDFTWSKCRR